MKALFPTPTAVTLSHINVRTEKHGDSNATALDLKFTRETSNECLELFCVGMREALYFNAAADQGQEDVPGVPAILPNLRFPHFAPLKWESDTEGAKLVIDYGLGGDLSNIVLAPCKVNAWVLEPCEGGTVKMAFRVQCSALPDGALDKLGKLLECETSIVPTPPEAKGLVIDGSVAAFKADHPEVDAKPKRGKKMDATELFVAEHGTALQ